MQRALTVLAVIVAGILCLQASLPFPSGGPKTPEQLGEILFSETLLSKDSSLSCASCHKPAFAFSDTSAFSLGVRNQKGNRNTPPSMNLSGRSSFFWDGRAATLEEQALGPIENPVEMDLKISEAVARLNNHPNYPKWFKKVFGQKPDAKNLALAIAAFERTLETSRSPFDRWAKGDSAALSESAKRGRIFFLERGKCFECHFGTDFTGDEFRSIGLYDGVRYTDKGRYEVTRNKEDIGKFKVPGLRNVAVTGPYMHDGSFKTLREVIELYNKPEKFIKPGTPRDSLLQQPLGLTEQQVSDIEAFLISLTDDRFVHLLKKN